MQFSTKKMGVNLKFEKMPNWRGGPRGVWQKTTLFPDFFLATFPYDIGTILRDASASKNDFPDSVDGELALT